MWKESPTEISAIIVTYNSEPHIARCIQSLLAQEGVEIEVLVVDNASQDGTVSEVQRFGDRVHLIRSQRNLGFGRGCNLGFQHSQGRFVFILNPDAWLEQADALARLKCRMERETGWGLVGPRVTSPDGSPQLEPALHYPDQKRVNCTFAQLPGKIAWVVGASLFIRRECFAQVEGFDPGFFLMCEEVDLCLRLRQCGWEIGHAPDILVRHVGFASECGADPYETWSRRAPGTYRFWSKHYPAAAVRRLLWKHWLRAAFRRQWYAAWARFCSPGSKAWGKHRRYAAISEAAWSFLRSPRSLSLRSFPQAGGEFAPRELGRDARISTG
jgi:N-acetylglucosaminyl-diphospho-decaprenol L-rhamnosyltransferase